MNEYLMKIQSLHNYELTLICIICMLIGIFFGKLLNK
jgi:hypothetical protein